MSMFPGFALLALDAVDAVAWGCLWGAAPFVERWLQHEIDCEIVPWWDRMQVDVLPGVRSVGVGGDVRTYMPVVQVRGPWGEHVEAMSEKIMNTLPVNRIVWVIGG